MEAYVVISPRAVMADAPAAAVDIILARRAWDVVVCDNDRDDNGKGGDPPVPSDDAASGGGDDVPTEEGGGHHRRNDDDDGYQRGHNRGGYDTAGGGEGREGVVALSGGRSRACV